MSQMMLYVFPLLLGRTFDVNKMNVGVDMYSKESISSPMVIENPITEATYKFIDNTAGARYFLDTSGEFSLNVKCSFLKAGAAGAYMSDVYNRENTVELAIKATYQTVTESLRADVKPFDTWQSLSALGTHYVKSIVYGGELIVSIRMVSNNTRNKQFIKASLGAGGRIKVFDLGAEVGGEYLSEVSNSVDSMQIKVYSSIPLPQVPHDMKSLKELLFSFGKYAKIHNNGKGVPLKVELWPLTALNSSLPQILTNRILMSHLNTFEQKLDDLLNTRSAIKEWMDIMLNTPSEEQEKLIGGLYAEVSKLLDVFFKAVGNLDTSKDTEQLNSALTAYGNYVPGHYYHKYSKLRQNMVQDQREWSLERGGGATYTHWGKNNCTMEANTIHSGIAVGPRGRHGGSNFLCFQRFDDDSVLNSTNDISIVRTSYTFPTEEQPSMIHCAFCRFPLKGSVVTLVGSTECPKDWKSVYNGIMLSGGFNTTDTDFMCLDRAADDVDVEQFSVSSLYENFLILPEFKERLSCTVCAK